jgi:hypothetical protein
LWQWHGHWLSGAQISSASLSGHEAAAERSDGFSGLVRGGINAMLTLQSEFGGFLEADAAADFLSLIGVGGIPASALLLGLVMSLSLLPLMLFGQQLLAAAEVRRAAGTPRTAGRPAKAEAGPAWPTRAWIELEAPAPGFAPLRHGIGHGMVRIGRDVDNDICLRDRSVHGFHAAIYQSEDAEYFIADLSSRGGGGVIVNGRRQANSRLGHGDTIELGAARMRFLAVPA